jgi:uncharacterized protein YjbI with pentapeptide repeats
MSGVLLKLKQLDVLALTVASTCLLQMVSIGGPLMAQAAPQVCGGAIVKSYCIRPGANLREAQLTGATLTNINLTGLALTGLFSGGINGNPTLPTGWKLVNGYLIGPGANLQSANLSNTNLWGGTMTNVNLTGAALNNANVSRAKLMNAKLTNAKLTNANLSYANLTGATCPNGVVHGKAGATC